LALAPASAAAQTPLIEDSSMAFDLCGETFEARPVDQIAKRPSVVMSASSIPGAHGTLPNGMATVEGALAPQGPWTGILPLGRTGPSSDIGAPTPNRKPRFVSRADRGTAMNSKASRKVAPKGRTEDA